MEKSFIYSLLLPVMVMYLLLVVRIFEKRMKSEVSENEERYFSKSSFLILGYRDFFLSALILDLVQISKILPGLYIGNIYPTEIMIGFIAFIIHLTLFIIFLPRLNSKRKRLRSINYLLDLYLGMFVLFTNALTLSSLFIRFI